MTVGGLGSLPGSGDLRHRTKQTRVRDILILVPAHTMSLSPQGNRVHLRICITRKLFSPFRFFQRLSIIIHNEIVNIWENKKQVSAQSMDKPGSAEEKIREALKRTFLLRTRKSQHPPNAGFRVQQLPHT